MHEVTQATFARRQAAFPARAPLALTDEFSNDKGKQTQWSAFLRKNRWEGAMELRKVIALLQTFFLPIIAAGQQKQLFIAQWKPVAWNGYVSL